MQKFGSEIVSGKSLTVSALKLKVAARKSGNISELV